MFGIPRPFGALRLSHSGQPHRKKQSISPETMLNSTLVSKLMPKFSPKFILWLFIKFTSSINGIKNCGRSILFKSFYLATKIKNIDLFPANYFAGRLLKVPETIIKLWRVSNMYFRVLRLTETVDFGISVFDF